MIYSVKGKISKKGDGFCVVQAGPVGMKIYTNNETVNEVSGEEEFFCRMYVRDDEIDLYGFTKERTLKLFNMLTSVSGVGPKTALNIFDIDTVENITAAIIEKRDDFLTKTSGIGKKTAGRIILDLHNKLSIPGAEERTKRMDVDEDVIAALVNLGYKKRKVKKVVSELGAKPKDLEGRLRATLKKLS